MYSTTCPKCQSTDGLAIVRATVDTEIPLTSEGFSIYEGRNTDTYNEIVRCAWCGYELPLKALTTPDCGHSACRQHWVDTGKTGCVEEEDSDCGPSDEDYVAAACDKYHREGEVEIDAGALVSRGEDPGAYVQAWVWVYDEDVRPNANGIEVEIVTTEQLVGKGFADPRES